MYLKKLILTCASGDDKLLQTQVYSHIILKDWKLEREERNKEEAATGWHVSSYISWHVIIESIEMWK